MRKHRLDTRFILASQSPRRQSILRAAGYRFRVCPAHDVEEVHLAKRPSAVVTNNARLKAYAVARRHPTHIVVGADTVVYGVGKILNKPSSHAHAVRMVHALSGKRHGVYTGVTICCYEQQYEHTFYERTDVVLKVLTKRSVEHYLSFIDPLDKAGAYAIQEHGELIVKSVRGSVANVVGFPIERFHKEYRNFLKGIA